jgi:hypothetical protein
MAHDGARPKTVALGAALYTAWLVAPILAAAGVILYLFPSHTAQLWAWPIKSQLTASAIGGGYLGGAIFFARAAYTRRWESLRIAVVGASALSTMLLITTIIHWDKFTHENVSFWAWTLLYCLTPVWLPYLFLTNERDARAHIADSPQPNGATLPPVVRRIAGTVGTAQIILALVMFVRPTALIDRWPWPLTPLTARTLSAFLAFIAVVWLAFFFEGRWSALRLPVQSAIIGLVLVGIAAGRRHQELVAATTTKIAFALLLIGTVIAFVAVDATKTRPRPD